MLTLTLACSGQFRYPRRATAFFLAIPGFKCLSVAFPKFSLIHSYRFSLSVNSEKSKDAIERGAGEEGQQCYTRTSACISIADTALPPLPILHSGAQMKWIDLGLPIQGVWDWSTSTYTICDSNNTQQLQGKLVNKIHARTRTVPPRN